MADDGALEARLQALRNIYIDGLPDKKDELKSALAALSGSLSDEALAEAVTLLRTVVHKLAGSAATYGFDGLGDAARGLENICDTLLDQSISRQDFSEALITDAAQKILSAFDKAIAEKLSGPATGDDEPGGQDAGGSRYTKVLIAESDRAISDHLVTDLRTFGLTVETVTQTTDLERVYNAFEPDVLLIDFDFPDQPQNGAEVIAALRETETLRCPVVFYSTRSDIEARLAAVRAGCQAFLVKPASAPQVIEKLDLVISHDDPEPYRILIIDDDLSTASYASVILSGHNMIAEILTEPLRVLETLHDFAPELILMDLHMPDCNGVELSEVIRQQEAFAGTPIVFLSGEADREKQIRAMNAGGDDFLTKPISAAQLVAAIRVRVQRFRALRGQMVSDSLTGLFNHTTTREFLDKEIGRAGREDLSICFLMLDIDHFKKVNDTYGHPIGDKVILSLARLLKQRLRTSDIIGRLGGEEFGVILTATSLESGERIAEEIRRSFSDIAFDANDTTFRCTMSIGLAHYPAYQSMADLIEAADLALYEAKHAGRNQVRLAPKPE